VTENRLYVNGSAAVPTVHTEAAVDTEATWCGQLELSAPSLPAFPRTAAGRLHGDARILIRVHGDPVGYVHLALEDGRVDAVAALAEAEAFLPAVRAHLEAEGLPAPAALAVSAEPGTAAVAAPVPHATAACSLAPATDAGTTPLVTVIVCTRDRPETLRGCLRNLRRLVHPRLEIIIVDNAPSDGATRQAFLDEVGGTAAFRYVREDRPGLSCARNRGVAEAHGEFVAFTDDDVTVDPGWITGLLRGFRQGKDVGCVTGLMATAALEEIAERYFDSRLTWSASCTPRMFDLGEHRDAGALYPYSAGIFGSGANIAFRAAALAAVGPFDEALGAGTLTAGGEDLDIFVRVLLAGYGLYYEPASLVWHRHRSSVDALGRQMFAYGAGMTAYLSKHLANRSTGPAVLARIPRGLWAMRSIGDRTEEATTGRESLQRRLVAWEYMGYLSGPVLYARSRRRARSVGSADGPGGPSVGSADGPGGPPDGPLVCGELELAAPPRVTLPGADAPETLARYDHARLLVRVHGEPVGYVHVPLAGGVLDPAAARAAALDTLADRIGAHLRADGLALPALGRPAGAQPACQAPPTPAPPVTVVVCTRDRPEMISRCLAGLAALTYRPLEIVVVDNAPPDDATREAFTRAVGSDPRFRYVREPRPGLSRARNRGLAEARGEIIAYTDDDVRVDPGWVEGVVRGFGRRHDVRCVTGLVPAASLDSALERYFDARVSWSTSCTARLYDLTPEGSAGPLHPFAAGVFGTGANFAVHTATLRELGGFDEALGAGTPTRGGEDLDLFVRVLLGGHALAYEPSALVWHSHRSEARELAAQMFGYGSGLTAYIAKYCLDPATRTRVFAGVPAGARHVTRLTERAKAGAGSKEALPGGLRLREFVGMAAGPALYWKARRREPIE
jgi:O-antigen biosynthesis protein